MNNKGSIFLTLAILGMAACAPAKVRYASEKLIDQGYGAYKTYAFLPTTDTNYAKLVNRQKFVPLLASEGVALLSKKGLKLDTLNPDCLFTYQLVVNRKYEANSQKETVYNQQVMNIAAVPTTGISTTGISGSSTMRTSTAPGSQVYYFSSDNRPYTYNGKMRIDTLREGSMIIDMIDAKTKKIIWRSIAEGKNYESAMPPLEQTIKIILPAMMKKLPTK